VTTFIERTPATRSTYFKASLFYLAFMTAWVYGFANTDRDVPGIVILFGLVTAMLVHFGAGLAMPRQETFALLAFPPSLALVGPGVSTLLWVPLVMMMVFPGAPLVLLGLYLRGRADPQEVEDYYY
jgi:succinate dehydrogenase/fumarate reductase cytochrome b subunit